MKKAKDTPLQLVDGKWYCISFAATGEKAPIISEECCDCGLVHVLRYKATNGRLYVQYNRDDSLTRKARVRRKRGSHGR